MVLPYIIRQNCRSLALLTLLDAIQNPLSCLFRAVVNERSLWHGRSRKCATCLDLGRRDTAACQQFLQHALAQGRLQKSCTRPAMTRPSEGRRCIQPGRRTCAAGDGRAGRRQATLVRRFLSEWKPKLRAWLVPPSHVQEVMRFHLWLTGAGVTGPALGSIPISHTVTDMRVRGNSDQATSVTRTTTGTGNTVGN